MLPGCSVLPKAFLACILPEEVVCLVWFLFLGYMEPTQTKGQFLRERSEGKAEPPRDETCTDIWVSNQGLPVSSLWGQRTIHLSFSLCFLLYTPPVNLTLLAPQIHPPQSQRMFSKMKTWTWHFFASNTSGASQYLQDWVQAIFFHQNPARMFSFPWVFHLPSSTITIIPDAHNHPALYTTSCTLHMPLSLDVELTFYKFVSPTIPNAT